MITILTLLEIIPFTNIFGVIEVVAGDIFTSEPMIRLHDFIPGKIGKPLACHIDCLTIARIQFADLPLILLFVVELIENMVPLVLETHASKTIGAASTVHQKERAGTIVAVTGEEDCVTFHTISAFITKLATETIEAVVTVF